MTDYETLLRWLQARRSIRRFTGDSVSREDLLRLLEAARWAPSNHNRQPWLFIVLEDRARIQALATAVRQALAARAATLPTTAATHAAEFCHYATIFADAPVVLIALHKRPTSLATAWSAGLAQPGLVSGEPLSVAMAVQNLLLAASALGLGTCVLTGPLLVPEVITAHVTLPPGHDLNCLIAVGHPAEQPEPPRRKGLEHIAHFEDRKDTTTPC